MDKPTYEELEAEVNRLNGELKSRPAEAQRKPPSGRRWARLGRGVLIGLGCLALVAVDAGLWANRTIISHDGYMAAVTPLVHEPAVQTALVKATQDQIQSNVNIQQTVQDALPDRAAFLAGPITTGVINSIHSFLTKAAGSDRFAQAWTNVNDRAHQRLVGYVSKYEGNGQITVADAASALSSRLQSTPLANVASKPLPPKFGNIQLVNASWLPVAHNTYVALQWVVPIGILVALLGFGLAIWASPHRRKTIIASALATAFALGLANIVLRLIEQMRQSHITDAVYRAAAHSVSQALTGPFINQTRVWVVVALIVAAVAWVPGPSAAAVRLRQWLRARSSSLMHATGNLGAGTPAMKWLRARRRFVEWALVALAVVVLMFLSPLTLAVVAWTAVALAFLVILVEIITSTTSAGQVPS